MKNQEKDTKKHDTAKTPNVESNAPKNPPNRQAEFNPAKIEDEKQTNQPHAPQTVPDVKNTVPQPQPQNVENNIQGKQQGLNAEEVSAKISAKFNLPYEDVMNTII